MDQNLPFERFDQQYLNDDDQIYQMSQPHTEEAGAIETAPEEDDMSGGVFSNVGQGLNGRYRTMMMQYWQETINSIEHDEHDFKNHQLPLARIKKVMKTDDEVRMISAEAPILFAKGCDIFITELTMRAWIHAEENKRRTLQRSDIAAALTKSDMFDFLIDIVPREEEKPKRAPSSSAPAPAPAHHSQPSSSRSSVSYAHLPTHDPAPVEDASAKNNFNQQHQQNLLQQHLLQQQLLHQQQLAQQKQEQETATGPADEWQDVPMPAPEFAYTHDNVDLDVGTVDAGAFTVEEEF